MPASGPNCYWPRIAQLAVSSALQHVACWVMGGHPPAGLRKQAA